MLDKAHGASVVKPPRELLAPTLKWLSGYKGDHMAIGLQVAVSVFLALLPVVITHAYKRMGSFSTVATALTVIIVYEPSSGSAMMKLVVRLLSVGVAGAFSYGIVGLTYLVTQQGDFEKNGVRASALVLVLISVITFLFAVHRERLGQYAYAFQLMLFTLPIMSAPSIRFPDNSEEFKNMGIRMGDIALGVGIAALAALLLFPVKARAQLNKRMAKALLQIGDLTVWLAGQVCVPPALGGGIPGASCTDVTCNFCDDGLEEKLAPLHATVEALASEVAAMQGLLDPADSEIWLLKKPRRFPKTQYQQLLRSCHLVLGLCTSLLYSMESVRQPMALDVIYRHQGQVAEVAVQLSATYTALSRLFGHAAGGKRSIWRCWRLSKKEKAARAERKEEAERQRQLFRDKAKQRREEAAADEPGGDAGGAQTQGRPPADMEMQGFVEDPFAGLRSVSSYGPEPSLVPLSSMDIRRVQQAARQQTLQRHSIAAPAGEPAADSATAGKSGKISRRRLAWQTQRVRGPAGPAVDVEKKATEVAYAVVKQECLAEAMAPLLARLDEETSQAHSGPGVQAFTAVVQWLHGISRQAAACMVAVDPAAASQLSVCKAGAPYGGACKAANL